MAIQGMKADAVQLMGEDQRRAIVAVVVIEREAMDDPVERGHHFGSGGPPDIDAEMQAAGLFPCSAESKCLLRAYSVRCSSYPPKP